MADTPVAVVTEAGISAPPYADVLAYFKDRYRGIYGQDVYLEPDSQDGQWLAIMALAVSDANAMAVAVYNAFSPTTAKGNGLASVVKINGLTKGVPTRSSVDLLVVGQAGATIAGGVVTDAAGARWLLPATVVIPPAGQVTVTATAVDLGAVVAPAGSLTTIATPTAGWQSVTNPAAATAGAPVEKDPALRARQRVSTALPSRTVLEGMIGAVAAVPGVLRYRAYENVGDVADANGLPGHCVALVVDGGDATAIAAAIAAKKAPGVGTFGTTTVPVVDAYGVTRSIGFFRPTIATIGATVSVRALAGFTLGIQARLQQAVADAINAGRIGDPLFLTRYYAAANLYGVPDGLTYEVTALALGKNGAAPAAADVPIAYNEAPLATAPGVVVTVVP